MKLSALLHDIGKLGYRAGENGNHSEIGEMIIKSYFPKELQTICGLISGHHKNELYLNPEGYKLLKIIVLSDWLSSSERIVSVEREQKKDVKGIPLQSVFSKIKIYKATKKLRNTYYY